MALNLKYLTEQLDIVAPEIKDLRKLVVSSLGNKQEMRGILNQQCENRGRTNCFSCDDQGICSVLSGVAHFDQGEINTAIKEFEDGNQHLRSKDETWNSIIGLVLLGKAYEKSNNSHQAVIEYKKALRMLTENYIRFHINDYDGLAKARILVSDLNALVTQPFSPQPSAAQQVQTDSRVANPSVNTVGNKEAYLSFFSLPIYGTVTAGVGGELHINAVENSSTIVDKVELEGKLFDVFSVGYTLSRDRQITLNPQESYGWAKVRGLSMNGWEIPLNENDFVLFRECQIANHNEFVVISSRDPSGDFMYIVKKYDGQGRQLISNSTDKSQPYAPIPLNEDNKIFGVVIAVAKPAP